MLLVLALALYILPREYDASQSGGFGLVDPFVTFFTGAMLHDYQVERNKVERARLVARLLETELSGMLEVLHEANAVEVRPTGTKETETVVPSWLEILILTDATREGFFDSEGTVKSMRVLGNVAARRVLVRDLLLPTLLSDTPEAPRALVRRVEDLRHAIIQDTAALKGLVSQDS